MLRPVFLYYLLLRDDIYHRQFGTIEYARYERHPERLCKSAAYDLHRAVLLALTAGKFREKSLVGCEQTLIEQPGDTPLTAVRVTGKYKIISVLPPFGL